MKAQIALLALINTIGLPSISLAEERATLQHLMQQDAKVEVLVKAVELALGESCNPEASVLSNDTYTSACAEFGQPADGVISLTYRDGVVKKLSVEKK